jgi:hypothetical protein
MCRTALLACALCCAAAEARTPAGFVIAGREVAAGERAHVDLAVPAGATDSATYVPVTVFHGAEPGPVLALTMGVHGYEFPPILAAQRLLDRIDARQLRGTVLMVRLAHVEAFEQRVPFEFHSGDGAEWLEAFVGVYGGTLAEAQLPRAREMGLAFGFPNVVQYSMDTREQVDRGRSLNRQAVADGRPTVLVEIGENGRTDEAFVAQIVAGVENLLRVLGMVPGAPRPPRADTRWFTGTAAATATRTRSSW